MKKFYFILMAMVAMVGFIACEGNNPELKNQPLNKKGEINKYWTPAGHTYFHDNETFFDVYRFYEKKDECVADYYLTSNSDMSVSEGEIEPYGLAGEYPNFTIVHVRTGKEHKCTFTDTLTCTIDGCSYKLYR